MSKQFNTLLNEFKDKLNLLGYVTKITSKTAKCHYVAITIKSPPFDDSYRKAIYEAECELLRKLPNNEEIDFSVINLKEQKS